MQKYNLYYAHILQLANQMAPVERHFYNRVLSASGPEELLAMLEVVDA